MRYVVGLMMAAFFLAGLGLFAAGARGLMRRFAARRRLRPAEGEIVRIEIRQEITNNETKGNRGQSWISARVERHE